MDRRDRLTGVWDSDLLKTLLLCAALGLGAGWFSSAHAPSLRWGDVPTWVAVLAAGLALYFARQAARSAHALLRIEEARRTLRETSDRAAQASTIGAWHQESYFAATLRNSSDLPVYDLTVEFLGPDGATWETGALTVLPPGEQTLSWTGTSSRHGAVGDTGHEVSPRDFHLAMTFRDSAGVRWRRTGRGDLQALAVPTEALAQQSP